MTSLINLLVASFLAMDAAPPAAHAAPAAAQETPAAKHAGAAGPATQKQLQRKLLAKAPANPGNGLPR